jgi:hypothetical protein
VFLDPSDPSIVAEKNATKNILGWTEGRTEVKQHTPTPVERGYNKYFEGVNFHRK